MKWNSYQYNTIEEIRNKLSKNWIEVKDPGLDYNFDNELQNQTYYFENTSKKIKQQVLLILNDKLEFKTLFTNCSFGCCGLYSELNPYFSMRKLRRSIGKLISK